MRQSSRSVRRCPPGQVVLDVNAERSRRPRRKGDEAGAARPQAEGRSRRLERLPAGAALPRPRDFSALSCSRRGRVRGAVAARDYYGPMALTLLAGPANAGKVALLLDRYLADSRPRAGPDRADGIGRRTGRARPAARGRGALLGGSIGTFDDVFERIAAGNGGRAPGRRATRSARSSCAASSPARRSASSTARRASPGSPTRSARRSPSSRPACSIPTTLDGDLAELYRRYRAELDRLGLWDRDLRRRYAAERLAGDLAAWDGRPVYAYGFEDLSAAQWQLLEAFAGRVDVTVSLQYEPGRAVFASLERTATDLARPRRRAASRSCRPDTGTTRIPRWPTSSGRSSRTSRRPRPTARARSASSRAPARARRSSSSPTRSSSSLRGGTAPERDPRRLPVARPGARAARGGIRRARRPVRARRARCGSPRRRSGTRCSRCSATRGSAAAAATCSASSAPRTPGSARAHADFLEGRLRGRGIRSPERARGGDRRSCAAGRSPPSSACAAAHSSIAGVRELAASMLRAAHGLDAPPATEAARLDLRAYQALLTAARRARGLERARRRALGRGALRRARARAGPHRLRARPATSRSSTSSARAPAALEVVFVLGLEEGVFPQRTQSSPFLDDDRRRELDGRARLGEARPRVARPLPLLHGVHPAVPPALPRPRGGDRRRSAAPAEPVLGGRPRRAPARRRHAVDAPPRALRAGLADRGRPDRARAAARARVALDAATRDAASAIAQRERLGAADRPRARRVHAARRS